MMIITERELRESWQGGRGQLPIFPEDVRFTDSASEFLRRQHPDQPGPALTGASQPLSETSRLISFGKVWTQWQPASRPGQESHTSLSDHGSSLHSQIDSLQALILLISMQARRLQFNALAAHLDTLAAYCVEVRNADIHFHPAAPLILMGKHAGELKEIAFRLTRNPQAEGRLELSGSASTEIQSWMRILQDHAREAETRELEVLNKNTELNHNSYRLEHAQAIQSIASAACVLGQAFRSGLLE